MKPYPLMMVCAVCILYPIHLLAEETVAETGSSGIISFSGEVVEQTCLINGHPAGGNFAVQLPRVESSRLKQAGQRDGETAFVIQLTGCGPAGSGVRVKFDAPEQEDTRVKRIAVTPPHDAASMAENVAVEVADKNPQPSASEMVFHPIDEHGQAEMHYVARYYATSPVKPGMVHSRVTYTLEYQ